MQTHYNTNLTQTVTTVDGELPPLDASAIPVDKGLELSITLGSPEYGLDTEALYLQILDAYNHGELEVTGACTELQPDIPDLDALYGQHYIAPVDAVMDPDTFEISADTYGYHFDLEAAKAAKDLKARFGQ